MSAPTLEANGRVERNRVFWMTTAACPSRCVYCGIDTLQRMRSLDRSQCVDVAEQLVGAGFREVVLGGGEALIYPHIRPLLSALRGRCSIALFSGGVPGDVQKHVETLGLGVDRVVFSLDAPDVQTNDRLRGRPGITRALIDLAIAVRKHLPHVSVSFNTVVSRHNCDRLLELYDLISKFGPSGWALTVVGDNFGTRPDGDIPSPEQLERLYFETAPAIAHRAEGRRLDLVVLPLPLPLLRERRRPGVWPALRDDASMPQLRRELEELSRGNHNRSFSSAFRCPLIGTDIGISASGWVYPCSGFPTFHEGYVMGDLQRERLQEILDGDRLGAFRRNFPSEACTRCWAPSNIGEGALDDLLGHAG